MAGNEIGESPFGIWFVEAQERCRLRSPRVPELMLKSANTSKAKTFLCGLHRLHTPAAVTAIRLDGINPKVQTCVDRIDDALLVALLNRLH